MSPALFGACRAPSVSMEFVPSGEVLACCANALYPIGRVGEESLQDIWTGPRAAALRAAVASGDFSLGCTICSHRIRHDGAELPLQAYESIDPVEGGRWPSQLSFSLHNTCNLACVMCGADRSSTIRTRRAKLPPLPHLYGDSFFEEIVPFLRHCSKVDFVGGESLLVREHWRVWDLLRELRPGIECAITTNGTIWNSRVEAFLNDFPTSIRISLDGFTAKSFEAVRVGAELGAFMRNFVRFRDYSHERGTSFAICWSFIRQTWSELGDALLWAEELEVPVFIQTVIERDFGVQHLPDGDLKRCHAALAEQSELIRGSLRLNRDVWDRQLQMLATEIDRRDRGLLLEPCMDPPTPQSPRLAAEAIRSAPPSGPLFATAEAGSDRMSLREYLSSWSLDIAGAGRLTLDRGGVITSVAVGDTIPDDDRLTHQRTLDGLLEAWCEIWHGRLWRIEELRLDGALISTFNIGAADRDGSAPVIVRMVSAVGSDGVEILVFGPRHQSSPDSVAVQPPVRRSG